MESTKGKKLNSVSFSSVRVSYNCPVSEELSPRSLVLGPRSTGSCIEVSKRFQQATEGA